MTLILYVNRDAGKFNAKWIKINLKKTGAFRKKVQCYLNNQLSDTVL